MSRSVRGLSVRIAALAGGHCATTNLGWLQVGVAPSEDRSTQSITRDHVGNAGILPAVLGGLARKSVRDPGSLRRQLLKSLWIEIKRFSAPNIRNVELAELIGAESPVVEGSVDRHDRFVLAALAQAFSCRAIFEIGTYLGETSWLLAHNDPGAQVFTLDLPGLDGVKTARLELTDPEYFAHWDRGRRFLGTPEASRITPLSGDSATFDFSPYRKRMDLVFIDASHSYSYVRSDTQAALSMLAPGGTIVWDDYTYYPGIYAYLNELSPRLDRPIAHLLGTRLAVYRSP
jgi:predicted O-methyltransferase YrrM